MAKRRVYESLVIDRVDLVDRGANFDRASGDGAHILLTKRDKSNQPTEKQELACPSCEYRLPTGWNERGQTLPNYCPDCGAKLSLKATTKQEQPDMSANVQTTDIQKAVDDAVAKALAAQAATLKAEQKAETDAAIAKAVETATATQKAENEALAKRVKDAEDVAKAEAERRETAECVKKAEGYDRLVVKADTDGALFYRLGKALPKEDVDRVHEILAAANEAVRVGKVFSERGRATGDATGTAEEKLLAKAEELRTADTKLDLGAAIAKARDLYPDLRREYDAEVARRTGTRAS